MMGLAGMPPERAAEPAGEFDGEGLRLTASSLSGAPAAFPERGDAVRDLVDVCDVLLRYGYTVETIKVIVDVASGKVK